MTDLQRLSFTTETCAAESSALARSAAQFTAAESAHNRSASLRRKLRSAAGKACAVRDPAPRLFQVALAGTTFIEGKDLI
jgi:hypothetical protein